MSTSTDHPSHKGKQPRLSDQLKASDLFPPGTGWNTASGVASNARVEKDAGKVPEAPSEQRQH